VQLDRLRLGQQPLNLRELANQFYAAVDFLKPGVKECEVLAVAWHEMTRMGCEWTQCSNIICSGPYTAPYRRFTSDRII
jgi:Xaa-Pro aminopeptidase